MPSDLWNIIYRLGKGYMEPFPIRNKTSSRQIPQIRTSRVGGGWGCSKVVPTFNHVGGSFNLFMATTGDVWIIFSNLGLCAACWARFMRHHKSCPTSVSHSFSYLNSSLGFTVPIIRFVLQNFAISGCFPYILFYRHVFSLLSSGWFAMFVIAVCGSVSVVNKIIVNWCRVVISKDKLT